MSDAANGESKFGFKDKEKAEETLQLLESHDMQYRKLTVRGLLGRAKRVLTMTKSEEKLKNINSAIGVFEKWLEENGGGAANKNAKTDKEDKVETVPGLGFKDKEAAEATLRILEGRDPDYQKLAIRGLIGSSKRVLSGTKNEDKIKSIQEGVKILEDFLEKFETENLIKNNRAYLAYSIIEQLPEAEDELAAEFVKAYGGSKAKGNYKHLRTMYPEADDSTSWDIIRNRNIAKIMEKLKAEEAKLFDAESGAPTEIHLELIHWAYSPQPDKVKAYVEKISKKKAEKRKIEHSDSSSSEGDDSEDDGQRSASLADEQDAEKLKRVEAEMSNYTNHTRSQPDVGTNATAAHELNSTAAPTRTLDAPKTRLNSSTASAVTTKSRLDARHSDTLEWLNAMAAAAALPVPKLLTNMPQATEIDREVVTGPTESAVDTAGAVTTQQRIPFTLENANKEEELRRAENEHRSRKSKVLSAEYKHINRFINYSSDTKSLLTRSASTAPNDFDGVEEGNISSEALSIQRTYFLDAGAISAICFTIFGVCCTMGTIGIVLYRRRYLNKPQALSEPDSSVYIDDSTMRVSDNSDEMYSLDNDSFLNSLEAMTIQNYWTDTVKHTKL